MLKTLLFSTLALLGAHSLFGYALEGPVWTLNRTVNVQLSLGGQHFLIDGFTSFNQSAADALKLWNQHLKHLTLLPILNSPVIPASDDDEISAAFSNTVFGDKFGQDVLAVTTLSDRNGVFESTDTLFNNAYTWDSYRGPLRSGLQDFHRVALHEFGHMLGLDHPDQAKPPQDVDAIMNSVISDIDSLQTDDISGVESLYNNGPAIQTAVPAPVLANISTRSLVGTGDNVLIGGFIVQGSKPATVILRALGFSLAASGFGNALSDPVLTIYDANNNQVAKNDDWFVSSNAETIASYHLDPPNSIESALLLTLQPGAYTAVIEGYSDSSQTSTPGIGLFELYDLHKTAGRAGNISTRGQILGGNDLLIGGFIVGAGAAKPVVVRGLGPSLGAQGVANPLADPTLELHNANGALVQSNDNWQQGADAQMLSNEGLAPSNPKEAALSATLSPGAYTVVVQGKNGTTGVGLVEIYDTSPAP